MQPPPQVGEVIAGTRCDRVVAIAGRGDAVVAGTARQRLVVAPTGQRRRLVTAGTVSDREVGLDAEVAGGQAIEGLRERSTGRSGAASVDDVSASRVALHLVVLDTRQRDVEVRVVVQVDAVARPSRGSALPRAVVAAL